MYSICTACDSGFDGKLNELFAWQLPGVKCPVHDDPSFCENSKCKYHFDEGDIYGCTEFILCDNCLSSPKAIRDMLKEYARL